LGIILIINIILIFSIKFFHSISFRDNGEVVKSKLITTHPPYANIISYTKNSNHEENGDLSKVRSVNEFCEEMKNVAQQFYRILKPGKFCAILMGDIRRHKHEVPICFRTMQSF
jgi:DNA modification methylase